MSFYGDVDLEEPSDCEGGSDSSDDDALNLLLTSRSRPALRRRRRSSSRGSNSGSQSRSRSRSLSRNRVSGAAAAATNGVADSAGVARLHLLNDAVIGRDDVERLVAASQRRGGGVDDVLPGGACRRLIASSSIGGSSALTTAEAEDEDATDFERMMEEELDQVVVKHVENQKKRWEREKKGGGGESVEMDVDDGEAKDSAADAAAAETSTDLPSVAQEFYDDIYFDSDDNDDDEDDDKQRQLQQQPEIENENDSVDRIQRTIQENEQLERKKNKAEKKKKKHPVLTNDELFYDPDMDDEDQKWVDERRRKNFFPAADAKGGAGETPSPQEAARKSRKRKQGKDPTKLPNSDATLSCPACMTTLSMDCQKHEIYAHQYRAMFVSNCVVDENQVLTYPKDNKKKGKNNNNKKKAADVASCSVDSSVPASSDPSSASSVLSEDNFHPVRCAECETQVAVYDKDEIYYFFNVLASH